MNANVNFATRSIAFSTTNSWQQNISTGVTTTTRTTTAPKEVVKLDEATAKFAKAMGLAEDSDFVQQSVKRTDL